MKYVFLLSSILRLTCQKTDPSNLHEIMSKSKALNTPIVSGSVTIEIHCDAWAPISKHHNVFSMLTLTLLLPLTCGVSKALDYIINILLLLLLLLLLLFCYYSKVLTMKEKEKPSLRSSHA